MMKKRVLFLGTPDFAVTSLQRLLEPDLKEQLEVVGVVTQPDRPAGRKLQLKSSAVKDLALSVGLPVLTPDNVNTEAFREQISALQPDGAIVVAFGQILGQKFLELFRHGSVNVHGSLLPRWRGAAPIQRAVMEGDTKTGVALQIIVRKLDAGPVLGERELLIPPEMDALMVHDQLKVLGADLLANEYLKYLRGEIVPKPQDESQMTVATKIDKGEARINWQWPARVIFNRVRGMAMGPIAHTTRDGAMLKIYRTHVSDNGSQAKVAGAIVEIGAESFRVACGQGTLEVFEVQPESRARLSVAEYLRGHPMKIGDRLS